MIKRQATEKNEVYDPLIDDDCNLEQITMYIRNKNEEVKQAFKRFCDAPPDSELK